MSLIQKSANRKYTHSRKVIGIHPVIQFFIEKLNVHAIINSYFPADLRTALSFEKTVCALVHNILGASGPMYEIADWSRCLDETCIGLDQGESQHICDDRIGRALEKFYNGRHKDFFFQLALRAIKIFRLDCSSIHQDTTSITFSGKYDNWTAMELATYGHNKDHRPDLKQLVLGVTITRDGAVPLCHKVYSGNQSDDTLHVSNFLRVRKLLQMNDFIYVADSKLATLSNLNTIQSYGGRFISVMPRTWAEDDEFRKRVEDGKISWRTLWVRKDGDDESRYDLAQGDYVAKGFKTLWIRSTSKQGQDAQSRQERVQKAINALNSLSIKLNKRNFKQAASIKAKVQEILKANRCDGLIVYDLTFQRKYQKIFAQPGRPRAGKKAKIEWENIFALAFSVNEDKLAREALCDGVFPLITNVLDKGPREILELYKYQPFLEKRHSQIKTWQRITPALLKKDIRVIAYVHMHVLALTISALIERTIRLAMKKDGIESLPLYPEGHSCPAPTFYDLERLFRNVEKYEVHKGEEVILFPAELTSLQKQVLGLLGVPVSAYH